MLVERRSAHPLLPFRILADRTRGVSFVVMLLVGAGMFAMFYFLSLFIQNVLGYSPLKTGFAFLPFSAGIVAAADARLHPGQQGRPALDLRARRRCSARSACGASPT